MSCIRRREEGRRYPSRNYLARRGDERVFVVAIGRSLL
jgi:hypothetical protein